MTPREASGPICAFPTYYPSESNAIVIPPGENERPTWRESFEVKVRPGEWNAMRCGLVWFGNGEKPASETTWSDPVSRDEIDHLPVVGD